MVCSQGFETKAIVTGYSKVLRVTLNRLFELTFLNTFSRNLRFLADFMINSCAFISSISSGVGMVFKNCPQGLPLIFQGASFGAIKFFWGKFFIGSLAGSGPEITT